MPVQVWFAQEDVSIVPGTSISMSLAIENVGDHTETFTVIPAGMTAAWTTITRANVTLFAGSRDVIEVVVRPPAIHTTTAGPTGVAVRVIPEREPDDAVVAEAVIGVAAFDDRRITTLQPVQRARRRATFEFMVENHGNALASCRMHLVDATGRVDGNFDPPAVGVAPGAASLARANLRVRGGGFRRSDRHLDIEVEAAEPGHDPAVGRATLIQPPTISGDFVRRTLGIAALIAAVVASWFGVVRPELRDAADSAVAERVEELRAAAGVDDAAAAIEAAAVESTVPETPDDVPGDPVSYRIAVDVGVTQDRTEALALPPDARFELTDLVVQNPNGDLGTAELRRNEELLYVWDLATMTSANEFQPRVSPLPFEPNDQITLRVICEVVGEPTGTGCEIAVLVGGRLFPAEFE